METARALTDEERAFQRGFEAGDAASHTYRQQRDTAKQLLVGVLRQWPKGTLDDWFNEVYHFFPDLAALIEKVPTDG